MKKLLLVCVVGVLAPAAASGGDARSRVDDLCIQQGETPVHLKASDGAVLYGVEVGKGTTGVVLGHQVVSDHCELMAFARKLAEYGYRALAIDFRDYGKSSSKGGTWWRLDRDVAAAVARLRADGATRIKLLGASMGGTAMLVAASRIRPPVDGVISLSGPDYYRGLNALRAVKQSRVPVRFLVSRQDRRFASDASLLMRSAAAKDKAILRLTEAGHGSSLLDIPAAEKFVLSFLAT